MSETLAKNVKGYKVFNPDWTCRNKQYTCPGKFEENVLLNVCHSGMHFCERAVDCFNYYDFNPENKIAEVVAYGNVIRKRDKCCTDKLKIIREISWQELLEIINTGKGCTGLNNSGNYNSGNYNTGNYNSGDYNQGNFSNGCFNTEPSKIYMFNKPSEWTLNDWLNSGAYKSLYKIFSNQFKYVFFEDMTDDEKASNPKAENTGGYLKEIDIDVNDEWRRLTYDERENIISMPNFDKEIFKEITGIDVDIDSREHNDE